MGTTTVRVSLRDETRERLRQVAARNHKSEAEIAATLIEGGRAVDELEVETVSPASGLGGCRRAFRSSRGRARVARGAVRRYARASAEGHESSSEPMEVFWLEGALADLDEIFDSIPARNPAAARKVIQAMGEPTLGDLLTGPGKAAVSGP
jgi:hypothetical protein